MGCLSGTIGNRSASIEESSLRLVMLMYRAILWRFRYGLAAVPPWAILVVAGAGCGMKDQSGIIAGCVTLDGKPLTHACVMFENTELAVACMAPIDESGRYTVRTSDGKGLPAGRYIVRIVPGAPLNSESPTAATLLGGHGKKLVFDSNSIPERYCSASTSDLTAQVESGVRKTVDFSLRSNRIPSD